MRPEFYARPVLEVARDLLGCIVRRGERAGLIVETEAYHENEPSCHAWVGETARSAPLFGEPGRAYVYRCYGIHAMLNAVCEPAGTGAAVLIRALEPLAGEDLMRASRGREPLRELCSGPGKLAQALDLELHHNGGDLLRGPVVIEAGSSPRQAIITSPRIGISKAVELPWRFSVAGNPFVSRPLPVGSLGAALGRGAPAGARARRRGVAPAT